MLGSPHSLSFFSGDTARKDDLWQHGGNIKMVCILVTTVQHWHGLMISFIGEI
jgi:hypothetical protein